MHPLAEAELAASPTGTGIPFRASTGHVHRTWARTFSSLPELYVQPQSEAEVEKAVSLARRCGRRVVVTGCAHSPSDLTCTSSWMLNLDDLARVVSVDAASGLVVAQAGVRLYALCDELARHGLAMANLGSINEQSLAGAISTGTHGSSARHGLVSDDVVALRVTLASGLTEPCSPDVRPDLFRAALLSLGALGVITEVTLRAVPAFSLAWRQTVDADAALLDAWERGLWTQSEFVRAWWFPYTRRAVVWRADKTTEPHRARRPSYYDGAVGYYVYHNLLYLAQWAPRILPWVEWFVFGMQYGFANGAATSAVEPGPKALLMNCLYSQYVNEWAIPLHRGPEALRRLASWLNRLAPGHADYVAHGIPFSSAGLYVHAPLEVRVSDTTLAPHHPRPFLDPTVDDGPTLYLNATLYRPYLRDPPCRRRYYEAFEWLMRDMGGRPHWAKNFAVARPDLEAMYGPRLDDFRRVRDRLDPDGMFVGPWHRRRIMAGDAELALEEVETGRRPGPEGGVRTFGRTGQRLSDDVKSL
ncbi:hypothetical protein G6O67_001856 [Ophiocordyceps sinensis]|uniref:D-arabinono-1,4-lactone oxidase n=1 Tax=Ophiocordyceps sinensis TaxID=72228 RepID=A0A8H4PT23_9HYPO|nr:hypothetical protein G6O67_001856 [Ophiocordyceps sinensis]